MSDVTCPYCGKEQEIDHYYDNAYDENEEFDKDCVSCGKEFIYTVRVTVDYNIYCKGRHVFKGLPISGWRRCINCDYIERS